MSRMDEQKELEALLQRIADETIDPGVGERLERLLGGDSERQRFYFEYLATHVALEREGRFEANMEALRIYRRSKQAHGLNAQISDPTVAASLIRSRADAEGRSSAFQFLANARVVSYAVAASLLLALYFGGWAYLGCPAFVATIVSTQGDTEPIGERLREGESRSFRAGRVQVEYLSGTVVTIEGPAVVGAFHRNGLVLDRGRLVASVPKRAVGFAVQTPSTKIVDLGTEFGVNVDPQGTTETVVFEGLVEVATAESGNHADPENAVLLGAGDLALIDREGTADLQRGAAGKVADRYVRGLRRELSLAGLLGGGDGRSDQSPWRSLDPTTGLFSNPTTIDHLYADQPGRLIPVDASEFITGVFVPGGDDGSCVLTPSGQTFRHERLSGNETFGPFVLGAPAPPRMSGGTRGENVMASVVGGVDYGGEEHSIVFMHSNKGVTLDLRKLSEANAGLRPYRFRALVGSSERSHETRPLDSRHFKMTADFWVLVDGEVAYERIGFQGDDGMESIEVRIPPDAEYLTLIAGNGDIKTILDWVVIANGRLIFSEPNVVAHSST